MLLMINNWFELPLRFAFCFTCANVIICADFSLCSIRTNYLCITFQTILLTCLWLRCVNTYFINCLLISAVENADGKQSNQNSRFHTWGWWRCTELAEVNFQNNHWKLMTKCLEKWLLTFYQLTFDVTFIHFSIICS